jgi:uncharacterized protein YoxC
MADSQMEKYRPKNLPIYFQYRKFKWDQFFVGVFGACAVFGVLMKLWKTPFWGLLSPEAGKALYDVMMPVGFLGECIVFIIMGFMKGDAFIEVYPDEMEEEDEAHAEDDHMPSDGVIVNMELPESLRALIEEKVSQQLDDKVSELTNLLVEDVERTRGLLAETNEVNTQIQSVGQSLSSFNDRIQQIGESLGEFEKVNAGNISENAQSVSERLENTGNELKTFEDEMKKLANRFRSFNSVEN